MDKSSSKRRNESSNNPKRSQNSQSSPEKSRDRNSKPKKSKTSAQANKNSASDPVRLHITPLTAESAKAIIAAKHLSTASFHAIDTFPEKSYGFVTVPQAEADALRRKYNGTVFRGVKMSVEEARPAKEIILSPIENGAGKAKKISPSKASRKDGVFPGFELPEGRNVKRGWTRDTTQKVGNGKGKSSAGISECLFKTVLPPVVATEVKKSEFGEDKSSKKKTKGKTVKNQVVVKEFKHSTKFPSFLKMSSLPTDSAERSAEFVDGVGWVNDAGDVIEGAPAKRRKLDVHEESRKKKREDGSSSSEGDSSDEKYDDPPEGDESSSAKSGSPALSDSESSSNTGESEDDSESSGDETGDGSEEVTPIKATSNSESADEASSETSGSSSSESTSSSDSESESEAESREIQESTLISTEPVTKRSSSNFANLTSIFKPKLSLDTEATSQFKFFGGDVNESDGQGGTGSEAEDEAVFSRFNDNVPYTPTTPQAERYRSGAPTPDTAVAPRFKDFLPFPKDFSISIERNYFPTITAEEKTTLRRPSTGVRLLFPHTYDENLHVISIWGSVKLPKTLTTGELPEKQAASQQEARNDTSLKKAKLAESENPTETPSALPQPKFAPNWKDNINSNDIEQSKTNSGSKIIGWAGKKRTFEDGDDFGMVDAPASAPPKAKTGAGSGIVGWAGKKKTFGDEEDDGFTTAPVVGHQIKAKTGAGSGVTGWAGKKKTFDDDDDDLGVAAQVEVPTKTKTGVGSGVTAWAGKKKTFDDDDDDEVEDQILELPAPKTSSSAQKATMSLQEKDDGGGEEQVQLPLSQMWEKVFYENRGDWNRQWKRKKREAAKAKRKKEKVKRGWSAVSAS